MSVFLDDARKRRNRPPAPGTNGTAHAAEPSKPKPCCRYLPEWKLFPLHTLPPVVRDLVEAGAAAIGCDPAFIAVPALAVVAGCIGNARSIRLKRGWTEPCAVWAMTIAESGGHKSPGYDLAVSPLYSLHHDADDEYKAQVEKWKEEHQAWKKKLKKDRDKDEEPKEPIRPPTFVTDDATIEAVARLLDGNPHGLMLASEELNSWFQSFTRYKSGGGSDQPRWLNLHSARPLRVDRAGAPPLSVRRATTSVTGTIQDDIAAEVMDRKFLRSGMGPRFLLAMPPRRLRVWTEDEVPDDVAKQYQKLLGDLQELKLKDPVKREPRALVFSLDAKPIWVKFFNEWGIVQYTSQGEQRSAFGKIEAYAPRFALIHHVVSNVGGEASDLRPVNTTSILAGVELAQWFAYEATRVYAMLRESEEERDFRKLAEWIQGCGGRATVRDLQRSNSRRWPTSDDARVTLDDLVAAGLGEWQEEKKNPHGGQPLRVFVIFPPLRPTPDTSDT